MADPKSNKAPIRVAFVGNYLERFWARVEKTDTCWQWCGTDAHTYGTAVASGHSYRAHRVAYELTIGPIPDGLTLDHLCRNRGCVNPAHLEPVTNRENILRGECPHAHNARKTHCRHGHPLSGSNLLYEPHENRRRCRTCARAKPSAQPGSRHRRRLAARAKRAAAAPNPERESKRQLFDLLKAANWLEAIAAVHALLEKQAIAAPGEQADKS